MHIKILNPPSHSASVDEKLEVKFPDALNRKLGSRVLSWVKYHLFKNKLLNVIIMMVIFQGHVVAQDPWSGSTYPDEAGFKDRMKPMIERIAAHGFGVRSLANSKCPDTGLPVKTWAVEGETIISPYTGRTYIQGPTGYFGPKKRNEKGEIIAFGGDPLKYDLSPAAASMMLGQDTDRARAFLSIPGNLRQQYHFACSNWARAYPLIGHQFSDSWKSDFFHWISVYQESRRPSDGAREFSHMSHPHNLVGQEGELLGGNPFDGGTENHKTMWRTSALLYSQLLPDTVLISGYPGDEAESITKKMLREYLKKLVYVGNGEYDSDVYYPYTIKSFLNLYDFSPDPETKQLAKFALDYYFATYGLKTIDGAIAGAQKRGYLTGTDPGMMEIMQWGFFNNSSRNMNEVTTTLHQATTTYRPNEVIYNITRNALSLPFEAKMSRPFYHMDQPFVFAETFYKSKNFGLGNIQMTIVDNPNQQMVWSIVAKGTDDPLCFSGGHPMRGSTSGHSPFTQTLQSKGTLMLMTAPTKIVQADTSAIAKTYRQTKRNNLWIMPKTEQPDDYELSHRQKYANKLLHKVAPPVELISEEIDRFWSESMGSASSWFFYPKELKPVLIQGNYYIEANDVFIAVIPMVKDHVIINPPDEMIKTMKIGAAKKFFDRYALITFLGEVSGFVVEVVEKSDYHTLEDFAQRIRNETRLDLSHFGDLKIAYTSIYGDELTMDYQPTGLRCKGSINGEIQDWDQLTHGAVYQSPYLNIKNGIMEVSDAEHGYTVDFTGDHPVWKK